MAKTALVTDASSGIGKMIARELKSAGFSVYAAARRLERMADLEKDGIVPIALDLTRDESIVACVKSVLSKEKSIDVLVNNAGYGSYGAIEDVPLEKRAVNSRSTFSAWRGSFSSLFPPCASGAPAKSGQNSAGGIMRQSTPSRGSPIACAWS